jgi:predicted amidohydrolase
VHSLADSQVLAPTGEVVARATSEHDEVVVAVCDLDLAARYRRTVFDFARYRRPEHYGLITSRRAPVAPPLDGGAGGPGAGKADP